jgi:hypothetical protein
MFNDFYFIHKNMWIIFVLNILMLLHLSVSLLNFVTETQQQENVIHSATTLSEARGYLAAISSGELVFFAGGENSTGQPSAAEQPRMDLLFIWDHLRNKGPIFPSIL